MATSMSAAVGSLERNGPQSSVRNVGDFSAPDSARFDRVDSRLQDVIRKAADASDYDVRVTPAGGAVRGRRSNSSQHVKGNAVDVQLVDRKTGKALPNYQDAASFRAYEEFAQTARAIQESDYPELSNNFRWGGYFSGALGTTYGAMDLMHFDLGPTSAMKAGSWELGLSPKFAETWGVPNSVGLAQGRGPTPPGSIPGVNFRDASAAVLKRQARPPVDNRVKFLQQTLNEQFGFNLTVDGKFGEGTENALKQFQKAAGLTGLDVDGAAGPQTWGMIGALSNRPLPPGTESVLPSRFDFARAEQTRPIERGGRMSDEFVRPGAPGSETAQDRASARRDADAVSGLEDYARQQQGAARQAAFDTRDAGDVSGLEAYSRAAQGDVAGQRRMEDQAVLNQRLGRQLDPLSDVSTRPGREINPNDFSPSLVAPDMNPADLQQSAEAQRRAIDQRILNARLGPQQDAFSDVSTRPAAPTGRQPPTAAQIEAAKQQIRDQQFNVLSGARDNLAPPGIGPVGRSTEVARFDPGNRVFDTVPRADADVYRPSPATGARAASGLQDYAADAVASTSRPFSASDLARAAGARAAQQTPFGDFMEGWSGSDAINFAPEGARDLAMYSAAAGPRRPVAATPPAAPDPNAPIPRRRPDQLATAGDVIRSGGFVRAGSSGPAVQEIQRFLNQRGYTDDAGNALRVDGRMGEMTAQALQRYQQDHPGLRVDRIVGNYTLASMQRELGNLTGGGLGGQTGRGPGSVSPVGIDTARRAAADARQRAADQRDRDASPTAARDSSGTAANRAGSFAGSGPSPTSPAGGARAAAGGGTTPSSRASTGPSPSSPAGGARAAAGDSNRSAGSGTSSSASRSSGPSSSSPAGGSRAASSTTRTSSSSPARASSPAGGARAASEL